jgi:hypothetical protein
MQTANCDSKAVNAMGSRSMLFVHGSLERVRMATLPVHGLMGNVEHFPPCRARDLEDD